MAIFVLGKGDGVVTKRRRNSTRLRCGIMKWSYEYTALYNKQ